MKLAVTTAATGNVIEWASLKTHLRVDNDAERDYVLELQNAAVANACEAMECSLLSQTYTATFYADERIYLPRGPVTSVTSVVDDNGQTITTSGYTLGRVGNADYLAMRVSFKYP